MVNRSNFRILLTAIVISVFTIFSASALTGGKDKNIVETAVDAGSFTILAKALTEAGLIETLQDGGPFTVFAPTDEAFGKLPEGTIDALLKDKEALKNILLYHVVSGNVTSDQVAELNSATTLSGSDVKISVKGKNVMINDSKVIKADVSASNGTIHVIDTVLLPPAK